MAITITLSSLEFKLSWLIVKLEYNEIIIKLNSYKYIFI